MVNKEQEFIIARGIPGSGKSTWAEKWVQEDPLNRVRVNRDDLRRHLIQAEPDKWSSPDGWYVYKDGALDSDFEQRVTGLEQGIIHRALKTGKSVVSDNTNLPNKACKNWVKLASRYNVPVRTKEFPISMEEAIKRDAARDRKVGPKVIEMMFKRLGPNGEFHHVDGTFPVQQFKAPEKIGQHAVGFDMDGTLNDIRPVRHFVDKVANNGRRDFDSFHRGSLFCPPNREVVQMLKDAKEAGFAILITTARSEQYREVSQRWLHEQGIEFDNYYCRANNDQRPDYEVKKDMYDEISKHYDLVHQVDDNPQAVSAWQEKGVLVTTVPGFLPGELADNEQPKIVNLFRSNGCLRCGKPLKSGRGIGPRCAKKI